MDMAGVDVIPGLFKLDLPITDKNINQDTVKRKLLDIEQDLRTRLGRPEELAILNLLGLLKFALKRYSESQEHFLAVLEKDPDNLNALANMQHVLLALYRKKEARYYQDKWEDLINQDARQKRTIKARARCLAEQAYVYAVDMHTDENCNKRYEQSNVIFGKALRCAGEIVDTSEKDFWEFFIAKNLHKLFTGLRYRDNYSKANKLMERVVGLFFKIANRNPGDSEYQWESWRHLADIARMIKTIKHFTYSHFQPQLLRDCINDPVMCMERAMIISPDNPRLLARYANFVYSLKRENCYRKALEMLYTSIRLDDSCYNFYAFSTRGMIYVKSYQWQMRKYKEGGGRFFLPHPNMLENAKADLEKAVEFRNTAWDLLNLATVYHHLAKCDTVVSPEKQRQYLELELQTLKRCEDCGDHSERRQKLQQTLGRCFFDLGEYRESIDYFKKAVVLESAGTQYSGYFREMFCSYLSLLRSEDRDENAQPILEDMVQSMRKAMTKYGSGSLTRYCFTLNLYEEYDHELQMLYNYCKKIDDSMDILALLRPAEMSPQFAPVGPGGTLKGPWEMPIPQSTLDNLARESRTQAYDDVTKRNAGSSRGMACALGLGSDTQGGGRGLETLVSGVEGMKVRNLSGQVRPGYRSDVTRLAASQFEGSDTLKEDEGIGPLMSGIGGTQVRNSSGQKLSGNRSDVTRLAASQFEGSDTLKEDEGIGPLMSGIGGTQVRNSSGQEPPSGNMRLAASQSCQFEGSDTQEEEEGIGPLVSGVGGMEIRIQSGQDVQEPGAQSQSAVESSPGTASPEKEHGFLYDFYVMHGDSDEKWVEDTLLHELKIVRRLKGCTQKDAALGSLVLRGILDLMEQCACILVLHGEEFEEGQYLEHQTLIHQKKFGWTIIPIEKDGSVVSKELGVFRSFDARAGSVKWDILAKTIQNKRGAPSYSETKEAHNG
ncbi:tetratricopeptide repeat protein 22-like [Asterias amurensis]|uniref:tetratricopeptide repeat protein 22-like n=1 Tax=Asterias amurensis TaxID=7602 RepID=UPI003AB85803